jgi:hypothetical protein
VCECCGDLGYIGEYFCRYEFDGCKMVPVVEWEWIDCPCCIGADCD